MHWNIIGVKPAYYAKLYVVSKDFVFKKALEGTDSVFCQEYQKFFMSCYITFKKI